ncbi:MAG TPA: MFS transporter [Chloroflexota bacterium]|nr:MFS transporter [Chloroflexota bacterium]
MAEPCSPAKAPRADVPRRPVIIKSPRQRGPRPARDATNILANRALLTLMLGHCILDMCVGLLPILYPVLTHRFHLDLRAVGFISLAYSGMASITQPFFGVIADRYGTRLIGLALIWTATTFSIIGLAPTFPVMVALAAVAGVGSGMYHPMGAISARAVIDERRRNTAMAVYVTAGTIGVAAGPLLGALVFGIFGAPGTLVMFVPGIATALWLLKEVEGVPGRRRTDGQVARGPAVPVPLAAMAAVILVMMSRNWTVISFEAYIPSWYKSLGYGAAFYGPLATTVVLASALGTVGSGRLADRYGRRGIITGTLVLTLPFILLFAQFTGPSGFVTGGMVGLLAASTGPLTLVMAQELMAGSAGLASGLVMGLAFVTGAIGVPITGAVADAFGMRTAFRLQIVVVLATLLVTPFLPTEGHLAALGRRRAELAAVEGTAAGAPDPAPA